MHTKAINVCNDYIVAQKSVLIIVGHPQTGSFNHALAEAYASGVISGGGKADEMRVGDLKFDHAVDPRTVKELEPDILEAQERIRKADHVVWVYPLWWGSAPSLLKAFVDRVFITGFAMEYQSGKAMPKRLLTGRTSRIIITMDGPSYWHALMYKRSGTSWLRWATLWFSGFKTMKPWEVTGVRESTPEKRAEWLRRAKAMGERDAQP